MAIGAADIAFCDLIAHRPQAVSTSRQHGYRQPLDLTVAMVEFQDPDVRDSAVDAGMVTEVTNQPRAHLLDDSHLAASGLGEVVVPIGSVMLSAASAPAIQA